MTSSLSPKVQVIDGRLCYVEDSLDKEATPMSACRCGAFYSPFCPVKLHARKAEHQDHVPEMFWSLQRISQR